MAKKFPLSDRETKTRLSHCSEPHQQAQLLCKDTFLSSMVFNEKEQNILTDTNWQRAEMVPGLYD